MRNEHFTSILKRVSTLVEFQRYEYIVPEMILWCVISDERFVEIAKFCNAKIDKIRNGLTEFLSKIERLESVSNISVTKEYENTVTKAGCIADRTFSNVEIEHLLLAMIQNGEDSFAAYILNESGITEEKINSFISKEARRTNPGEFYYDMTELASNGKYGDLIGREKEIERIIQILHKKKVCNPILVADPGIGKTAIVEGLASAIVSGNVCEDMKNKKIICLDVSSLISGAKMRGEFEDKLKSFLNDVSENQDTIIFIDEIHMIEGAGAGGDGTMSMANIMKPYLSNGSIKCIGATTNEEYRKYILKDRAISRRFKKLDISEPSAEETEKILFGIRKKYEEFHHVVFPDEIIRSIVDLSSSYLKSQCFPDKAIEIMDEIGSKYSSGTKKGDIVTIKDVEETICSIANIREIKTKTSSTVMLRDLALNVKKKLFGQDEIIDKVIYHIKAAKAGLTPKNKPIGVFAFTGSSGVGKTELVKQISENLGMKMQRYDMSEFSERYTVSKLIGAPPGYIGFDQAGSLTESIRKNPDSVILFDEIEKADQNIYNLLLQIMDEGRLTDSNNQTVDFTNTIIFMTSNVGSRAAEEAKMSLGFMQESKSEDCLDKELKETFPPEFRNRFTGIYRFNELGEMEMDMIVSKELANLNERLSENKNKVIISNAARKWFIDNSIEENNGGRPVERLMNSNIAEKLVDLILFDNLFDSTIVFDLIGDEIKISSIEKSKKDIVEIPEGIQNLICQGESNEK